MKLKYFTLAQQMAANASHSMKHGAVLVKKGKVISVGFNKVKTHPKSPHPFNQIHAEVDAIFNSRTNLKGTELYIYRETKDGLPAMSKPCAHCQKLINSVGIKRIYYSIPNGYKGETL